MEPQAVTTSLSRSPEASDGRPHVASGLGRVRISGALRAFLQDSRGVPVYPAGS
ncbi:Mycobacterium numidiamassiliense ORFan [Mycobacterium numidiamassiliense]|uniref:Mycobacterium numidiamassiliense ORFan n=1 Tax=Mycobacterium numidiamassiliense TaxID=1841861 RepID=A0A2U3P889_9MYCO|nr:Mycobacterium numidiamassiliense ORFan [Mycobacterium numidiamassiliense]